jgi:predicted outer membrane repeat protein
MSPKNSFKVTSGADSGKGSLRRAIEKANQSECPYPQIIISECVTKIGLTSGELIVTRNLKIKSVKHTKIYFCNEENSTVSHIFHLLSNVRKFKLERLKLSRGKETYGGAIYSESDGVIILECCLFKHNEAQSGGAIYTLGSLDIVDSKFIKNRAENQGGAIFSFGQVNLVRSSIEQNLVITSLSSSGGGGIYVDSGNLLLYESSISHNKVNDESNGSGGGIIVMTGNIYLHQSKVNCNKAYNSSGIQEGIGNVYVEAASEINSNFSSNPNDLGGGAGITITVGTVYIIESELSNNTSLGMMCGGVVSIFGDVMVTRSKITGNYSGGPGGAIACNFDSSLIVIESTVENNTGGSLGGAFVNFSLTTTGIISVTSSTLQNNVLTNHQTIAQTLGAFLSIITNLLDNIASQATLNGGNGGKNFKDHIPELLIKGGITQTELNNANYETGGFSLKSLIAGGAIATLLNCPIVINECTIEGNFAGKQHEGGTVPFSAIGGAIVAFNGPVNITRATLKNNKVKDLATVWSGKSLTIVDAKLEENNGGAIYTFGTATLLKATLTKNHNEENGGGINNHGIFTLIDSSIEKNHANNGGGIFSTSAPIKINSTIKNNIPNNIVIV